MCLSHQQMGFSMNVNKEKNHQWGSENIPSTAVLPSVTEVEQSTAP